MKYYYMALNLKCSVSIHICRWSITTLISNTDDDGANGILDSIDHYILLCIFIIIHYCSDHYSKHHGLLTNIISWMKIIPGSLVCKYVKRQGKNVVPRNITLIEGPKRPNVVNKWTLEKQRQLQKPNRIKSAGGKALHENERNRQTHTYL